MAERIVSLTPSITETLYALGAGDRIVGVTDACDYPREANSKPHVCSWFEPDMTRIASLSPDLVVGLDTVHKRLKPALEAEGIKYVGSNPATVENALTDMLWLGSLLDLTHSAQRLVVGLKERLNMVFVNLQSIPLSQRLTSSRVLEIGAEDLIVAGPRSFQYDVIAMAGGINVTDGIDEAYPKATFQQFKSWDPEMVFVCGSDNNRLANLRKDRYWGSLKSTLCGKFHQFPCGLTCRTGPRIVDMVELLHQTMYSGTRSRTI